MSYSRRIAALLVAALIPLLAYAESNPLRLDDVGKIVRVSDPQLSPDGKSIVVIVSRPNLAQDRYDSSLVLIDVASGAQRTLTYERKSVFSPRWSPSGDRLAFLALAPAPSSDDLMSGEPEPAASAGISPEPPATKPTVQIYVLPMKGGEAHRLTRSAHDVEQLAWSPDGKQIAFAMADDNPSQKDIDSHKDAFEVGDDSYLSTEADVPAHLWIVSAEGGRAKRLTAGSWTLPRAAPPSAPSSPISWSPDGSSIAIVQQQKLAYGDNDQTVVSIVEVASGTVRKLTSHRLTEGFPVFSPDGSQIAYEYNRDGDPNNELDVLVAPTAGGDGFDVTRTLDRDIVRAVWMPDGQSLLLGAHDGTRVALWVQPLEGPARKLNLADLDPAWSFWIDLSLGKDGALTFTGSTPTHPNELYYLSSLDAPPRRLTDFNDFIAARQLGRVQSITWSGPDGFTEDGVVFYPHDFEVGHKYPLVLYIHGGPQAASTEGFSALPQLLAAHGYVVFSPNYRGSDHRGNAYQRAIFNDAGDGPGRDVMAGLAALERRGFIDTSRIAVSGWSYGGYMTSWMIGHYQIWRAAVSGAAVNDLVHAYALSDFNVTERWSFGGSPWSGKLMAAYVEQSPITYASRVKAPTLILSDTADARVPITQSYLMYHALKDNGVTVKFFAYPVPGHFPGDPIRTMDVYRRWIDWIDQYMR
ncbi:MAG TPA: S9 family peptidase [Steroidobacteraceae bacterium]|nr:S9 family peptidase [Steroidobacteraceae bacterium]